MRLANGTLVHTSERQQNPEGQGRKKLPSRIAVLFPLCSYQGGCGGRAELAQSWQITLCAESGLLFWFRIGDFELYWAQLCLQYD